MLSDHRFFCYLDLPGVPATFYPIEEQETQTLSATLESRPKHRVSYLHREMSWSSESSDYICACRSSSSSSTSSPSAHLARHHYSSSYPSPSWSAPLHHYHNGFVKTLLPETLNPKSQAQNPKPLNPKPLNPKPLNPKCQTRNSGLRLPGLLLQGGGQGLRRQVLASEEQVFRFKPVSHLNWAL